MQKLISLLSLTLIIVASTCSTGDPHKDTSSGSTLERKIVYVLFDYSRSLDTTSIKTTADRASKLVINCPIGMTIKFLPINNNPFAQPVFSYTRTPKPDKPQAVALWEKQNDAYGKMISDVIKKMHKTNDINSCIVHGFSTVYNHVKTLSEEKNSIKLVVLSDLLECCENMTCAQSVKGFKSLLKELNKYNFKDCPLSEYIPHENITLVINSSDLSEIKEIYNSSGREFYQFWETVAKGMGYEKGFVLSPNLPQL